MFGLHPEGFGLVNLERIERLRECYLFVIDDVA